MDADTIDVKATTGAGWETWLASVRETASTVVIEMRTKPPQGAGAYPAQDLWITVNLTAPLGDRSVIDSAGNTAVQPIP